MIKPTSKKTGTATMNPVIPSAHCALSSPNLLTSVWARRSAPPDTSSIFPNIAPRPTTTATKPSVPPIPFWMEAMTSPSGMPAATPTIKLTSNNETNA